MKAIAANQESNVLIDEVANWLMHKALVPSTMEELFSGCVKRLHSTGLIISRAQVTFPILHPLYHGMSMTWRPNQVLHSEGYSQTAEDNTFRYSPFYYLLENQLLHIRRHLTGEEAQLDYPILKDLQEQGSTDYFAYAVPFEPMEGDQQATRGILGSWTTDRPGGFTNHEIRDLKRIEQRLAVAMKVHIQEQITKNILHTYLGKKAGAQVLNGSIKRGDGQVIPAVIWYSDLRRSTWLAETLSGPEFLHTLNAYFECTAGSVMQSGGEVLRFIGDAVLAIFPTDDTADSKQQACQAAAEAARHARQNLKTINAAAIAEKRPAMEFGIGLHIGELLFGNIGIAERLEFSVIGPAANEVARLDDLGKKLDCRIIASQAFVDELRLPWLSLGEHQLRGVDQAHEVFKPDWLA